MGVGGFLVGEVGIDGGYGGLRWNGWFDIGAFFWEDDPMKAQSATQRPKSKPAAAGAGRAAATQKILKIVSPTDGGLPYFDCTPTSETFPSHEELQKVIEQSQLEEDFQRAGIAL